MPYWKQEILKRMAGLKLDPAREAEIVEELSQHLEERYRDLVLRGATEEDARQVALEELSSADFRSGPRAFPGATTRVAPTNELARGLRRVEVEMNQEPVVAGGRGGGNFFAGLWQDIRYGARMLRKNPGFTAVAVVTLALGIGANTAIFSYINAWVIKPLPYPHSERLMVFESHNTKLGWTREGLDSTASFLDFKGQNTSFEKIALWTGWNFNLTGDGPPVLVEGGRVSWNFFQALGAKPLLGRTFTPDEDTARASHVAVLSEGLWQSRYGADPKIIGKTVPIGGEAYTVVGIMPASFQFPLLGVSNLWAPLALTDKQRADRSNSFFSAFGLLRAGVTEKEAAAECATIFSRLAKQFPLTNKDMTLVPSSMKWQIAREEGAPELAICFVLVAFILLIACANVANLMLARAVNRTKEFALRSALGASRGRLVRQLLAESVLLFLFGGAAGLFVGLLGVRWIGSEIPAHIRAFLVNYGHVDLDITTLAFTTTITLLCGIAFGLAPANEHSKHEINSTLKEGGSQASGDKRSVRLRRILVAAEITLAVVVLISTTLLVKSFVISVRSSPGFNPANVMVTQLALPTAKYSEDWQWRRFSEDVLARIRVLPQVESAGAASSVPFGGFGRAVEVEAAGRPAPEPGERRGARFTAVSPGYFSAMQIGLFKGRLFSSADAQNDLQVAIVNRTMAHDLWPHEDPLGQGIRFGPEHTGCTIVGVVDDIKMYNLRERPGWQMYVPMAQFPSAAMSFVIRTTGDPSLVAPAMRDAIWAVDHDQPISSIEGLKILIDMVGAGYRILAKLLVFFAALAAFLGAIGIYGVMSDQVSRRTHEIGIRAALGARRRQVLRMVIGEGLKLALLGTAAGVACALGTSRLLAADLYRVSPYDPLTFLAVPVLFAVVALLASYIPARRATKVDPMVALRYE